MNAVATISPARRAAFDILIAVERGRTHADELLRGSAVEALSAADRNLATALVLGVLRWQIRLDEQIKSLLKRPKARLDAEALIALRLGAFQMLFLERVPAHAAIDESVELVKQSGLRFAAGMVNAVLRKFASWAAVNTAFGAASRQGTNLIVPQGQETSDGALASAAELALAEAHPAWLVERWVDFYGFQAARAICRRGQQQPPLAVRLEEADVEAELVQSGIGLKPGELLSVARTVTSGALSATAAFREGRVRIQDEGSQLIGELAACAGHRQNAGRILDACAAPGGKTLIVAERNPQARILACDSSAQRLAGLRDRLQAHAGRVEFRLADATDLADDSEFDLVLADVPCSGSGTLGRNPEIRHRLHPEDLARHVQRQRAILRESLRAVRPGGRVVYSTCSLELEENQQVVTAVLAETPNEMQVSLAPLIDEMLSDRILTSGGAKKLRKCLTPEGALRLLPDTAPTDGFFIALIEKTDQRAT